MEKSLITESEAYRSMQKLAMDKRKSLLQIANSILNVKS
ncbi:MAG: ANTAR domain-containing protein [Desulfuromonadaceae bacterium]|nr:ANTAR domain-containing protein [Desulfuromonadaceae bacterium]